MLGELIAKLKNINKYSIFALKSVKLALEFSETYKHRKNKITGFLWVEHYSTIEEVHPNGSYTVVNFYEKSRQPNWRYVSIQAIAKYTGYSEEYFLSPTESIKKSNKAFKLPLAETAKNATPLTCRCVLKNKNKSPQYATKNRI